MNIQAFIEKSVNQPHEATDTLKNLAWAFESRQPCLSVQSAMEYWYLRASALTTYQEFVSAKVAVFTATLQNKAKEYALGTDRFSNFRIIAKTLQTAIELAFWLLPCKQVASLIECAQQDRDDAYYDEKCGDIVCYMILLEMYRETLNG